MTGSIIWNGRSLDAGQVLSGYGDPCSITYSAVQCGHAGVGNIGLDPVADAPLFVDGAGADGLPGTGDDDLHLSPMSPCIDAGSPAGAPLLDIEGNARPAGSGFDMGAYEYQP